MRHMAGITMQVNCVTVDVLNTVKINLEKHKGVVHEARIGFIKAAKEALEEKLNRIKSENIISLQINLNPPLDYSSEYETIIKMLSMHKDDTITLGADEVRMFIEDKWDWTEAFLASNSVYSPAAKRMYGK